MMRWTKSNALQKKAKGPSRSDYPNRLRDELAAGYRENAERDLATAEDWFPLDEEAWERLERPAPRKRIARRS
jgi:hypothetical protein